MDALQLCHNFLYFIRGQPLDGVMVSPGAVRPLSLPPPNDALSLCICDSVNTDHHRFADNRLRSIERHEVVGDCRLNFSVSHFDVTKITNMSARTRTNDSPSWFEFRISSLAYMLTVPGKTKCYSSK